MKECSRCQQTKSKSEFYDGRPECKKCKSKQVSENQKAKKAWLIRYEKNPEEYCERNRKNYERLKSEKPEKLLEYRANKNERYHEKKKCQCAKKES